MDFTVFETKKIEAYSRQAKEQWGKTAEYKEFEEKSANRSADDEKNISEDFMRLFAEFGRMKGLEPADEAVQQQVRKLQDYISAHYYHCTDQILCSLGKMYSAEGEFKENIDKAGGEGTAEFAAKAIEIACRR